MTPEPFYNLAIRLQVYLERVKAGQMLGIASQISKSDAAIIRRLQKLDANALSDLTKREFDALLSDIRTIEAEAGVKLSESVTEEQKKVAEVVAANEAAALKRIVAAPTVAMPAAKAFRQALEEPISATGSLLKPFVDSIGQNNLKKTEAWLRRGYSEGMTTQQVVRGIRGSAAQNFRDGLTSLKTRQAEAVARTALQHVANTARAATWEANKKVVKGYRWLSTLDSATTPQCQALDGKVFKLGKGPTPPIHVRCRSTTVPDLNDGLKFLEQDEERSAAFGPVDGKLNFYDWLKRQDRGYVEKTLGKERAAIFIDRGLTVDQFKALAFDKNFKPMTVKAMEVSLKQDSRKPPDASVDNARVWALSEKLKQTLKRNPTPAEVVALAEAEGIPVQLAEEQFRLWKTKA